MKTALICGVSGQDGSYLANFLLKQGYKVVGTSRDVHASAFSGLHYLDIIDDVELVSMSLSDFRSVLQTLDQFRPDEIYNLAGQSSVGLSYQLPVETMESHAIGTLNLLEVIRFFGRATRLYNASSSECFGEVPDNRADEKTPFCPISPYAVAKAASHWLASSYRNAYGLYACSGILFNHESPIRPTRFVTRKIVQTACRIAAGSSERLSLGNLLIYRDWGWAPEYVEAMWKMLQLTQPDDFVIATGECYSLEEFVAEAFLYFGLNWQEYTTIDSNLLRPSDLSRVVGNPEKAKEKLDWQAKYKMKDVVRLMSEAESARLSK